MPELSEAAIRNLIGHKLSEIEIQQLLSLIATGQAILATGERAISVGGSANDAVLITGDRNILIQIHQADVSTLQTLKDFLSQYATSEQATAIDSVDELVQQVRSRIYDDIQRLHGTMPLWGVDHWVPLGELFIDVNVLEELSSNHRSELEDLWQDFQQNPTYRSLDRIGLGRNRERVSGLAVLEKNTNPMVVGKPGSGKTTYLQRVVTECNIGNLQASRIPVLIKLREFVEDGRSLSYSLDRYLEQYWQLTEVETRLILRQGRSLVLLDGLDEITGEEGKTITKQIRQFARAYPQLQIIVTCRTQSFSGEMDWKSLRFSFVEVADFNEAQVRSFTEHWFKTVIQSETQGSAKSQEFLVQLFREENKPIQDLVITPILLSLTCAVFHQTRKFYSKLSQLYEEGLELLLEHWDKSREIERDEIYRDLSVERKLELLSHLAVKKFEQEQYVLFEQAEIEGYIAEFLGVGKRESQVVLKAIESQHGLLIKRSQKVWSFSHLTFQEYLVATQFCHQAKWNSLANYFFRNERWQWREVFLIVLEKIINPINLLKVFQEKIDDFLASDRKAQRLLNWTYDISTSYEKKYKSSSLRALHLSLNISLESARHKSNSFLFDLIIYLLFNLEFCLYSKVDKYIYINNVSGEIGKMPDFSLSRTLDLDLDEIFMSAYTHIKSIPGVLWRATGLISAFDEIKTMELPTELSSFLIKLREEIPYSWSEYKSGFQSLKNWQDSEGVFWINQLNTYMIDYLNIGHRWEFSEVDIQRIFDYYNANLILVDICSNYRVLSIVDAFVLLEIKKTLLLPIAEIEKHKCNQAE